MFLAVFGVLFMIAGLQCMVKLGPYVDWFMSLIWQDPSKRRRGEVLARVSELCVDGDVPDETSVLLASKEMGISEKTAKEMMGGLTPAVLKGLKKGGIMAQLVARHAKAMKGIGE